MLSCRDRGKPRETSVDVAIGIRTGYLLNTSEKYYRLSQRGRCDFAEGKQKEAKEEVKE
jgi:hypothetical protein